MDYGDYRIALISALAIERACVEGMLDERHPDLPQSSRDANAYSYGRIGKHNVVIASLPAGSTGNASAATVATRVWNNFPKLKYGLMIGVGGGAPDVESKGQWDIRLGDVVVSKPNGTFGGVVQYNMGKTVPGPSGNGQFSRTGSLNRPPDGLLSVLLKLESKHLLADSEVPYHLFEMLRKHPKLQATCSYQGIESDQLFAAEYDHEGDATTCADCDVERLVKRSTRSSNDPVVHYGTIASGDQVMRHGNSRDRIAKEYGALCFEMETGGLDRDFPCLVIRGICDYADSHKNKQWQPYAAATAAAYAKEFLLEMPAEQDAKLLPVVDGISKLNISRTEPAAETQMSLQAEISNVPNRLVRNFVGREDVLGRLDQVLLSSRKGPKVAVLRGLGGQGKSQVALKYCQQKKGSPFRATFWLDASSETSVQAAIETVAHLMKAPTESLPTQELRMLYVQQKLSDSHTPWLLVFDNYDDPRTFSNIEDYFPRCDHGSILVTSRHTESASLVENVDTDDIKLQGLDNVTAITLLLQHSRIVESEDVKLEAKLVVNRLGNHPLAITQAGVYIKVQNIAVSQFLDHYGRRQRTILETMPEVSQYRRKLNDAEKETTLNVFTTWELSFQQLIRETGADSVDVMLVSLLSIFDRADISEELFWAYKRYTFPEGEFHCLKVLEYFQDEDGWNRALFAETVSRIAGLALIEASKVDEEAPYRIRLHPLVQDWIRLRTDSQVLGEMSCVLIILLGLFFATSWSARALVMPLNTRQQVLKHIASHAEIWKSLSVDVALFVLDQNGDIILALRQLTANFAEYMEHYKLAQAVWQQIYEARRNLQGEEHEQTLKSLTEIATALSDQQQLEEAESIWLQALDSSTRVLGEDHPLTTDCMLNIAKLCSSKNRLKESEGLLLRAMERCSSMSSEYRASVIKTAQSLAERYYKQERWKEAETILLKAIDQLKLASEDDSPHTLSVVVDLASVYWKQGMLEEAKQLEMQVIEKLKPALVEEKKDAFFPMAQLVRYYIYQGRLEEADKLGLPLLSTARRLLGASDSVIRRSMMHLVRAYAQRGWLDEAINIQTEVRESFIQVHGESHPVAISYTETLASLYKVQGRTHEARRLKSEAERLTAEISEV